MADESGAQFNYDVVEYKDSLFSSLYQKLDAVVIGVGGLLRDIDVLPIFTEVVYRYRKIGYRVTAVVDDPNASICGFVPFPRIKIEPEQPPRITVNKLNSFYNSLQYLYQPDIIISQIPDGLIMYQDYCTEDFGVNAFMISQAVSVDYFILAVPMGGLNAECFSGMSTMLKYRFGFKLGAIGITDMSINSSEVFSRGVMIYDKTAQKDVELYLAMLDSSCNGEIFYFNVYDSSIYEELVDKSINTLSQ